MSDTSKNSAAGSKSSQGSAKSNVGIDAEITEELPQSPRELQNILNDMQAQVDDIWGFL